MTFGKFFQEISCQKFWNIWLEIVSQYFRNILIWNLMPEILEYFFRNYMPKLPLWLCSYFPKHVRMFPGMEPVPSIFVPFQHIWRLYKHLLSLLPQPKKELPQRACPKSSFFSFTKPVDGIESYKVRDYSLRKFNASKYLTLRESTWVYVRNKTSKKITCP